MAAAIWRALVAPADGTWTQAYRLLAMPASGTAVTTDSFIRVTVGTAPSLVQQLQAFLEPLASGGAWYLQKTAEDQQYPYITWQRIVSVANVALNGPSVLQNTRVQIDVYTRSVAELLAIESAIEAGMQGVGISNVQLTSQDIYIEEARVFRCMKEYSIWASN